jgi:hypothetical protein
MIDERNRRETLKPNLSGNSEKRRCKSVLFPIPDGPDITRGQRISVIRKADTINQGNAYSSANLISLLACILHAYGLCLICVQDFDSEV